MDNPDQPGGINTVSQDTPSHQSWTQSGHPIVDGKFQDKDGVIRQIPAGEWTTTGPPVLDVFWINRQVTPDNMVQFRFMASRAFVNVTEYMARIGEFLRVANGSCEIMSLNATSYAINIIVATDLSHVEMRTLLHEQRLLAAR